MDFAIGGIAAVCAGFFTNPLEVIKIRMQLQGELQSRGHHAVHYKNVLHAASVIARHDGLLSLQSGLVPALWFQLFLNGTRLGAYELLSNSGYTTDQKGNIVFHKVVIVGGITGAIGAVAGSPFFLVKTQFQSRAAKEIAFGHQHHHETMVKAFRNIIHKQGFAGLYRASSAAIPRAFIGSTSQLTSFAYCKEWLSKYDILTSSPLLSTFIASLGGAVVVGIFMTPFDLISTRLYNQGLDEHGRGLLYRNYGDCVIRIWTTEGLLGFYKGIGPSYLRLGPHTVLCLIFWDQLKRVYNNMTFDSSKL